MGNAGGHLDKNTSNVPQFYRLGLIYFRNCQLLFVISVTFLWFACATPSCSPAVEWHPVKKKKKCELQNCSIIYSKFSSQIVSYSATLRFYRVEFLTNVLITARQSIDEFLLLLSIEQSNFDMTSFDRNVIAFALLREHFILLGFVRAFFTSNQSLLVFHSNSMVVDRSIIFRMIYCL